MNASRAMKTRSGVEASSLTPSISSDSTQVRPSLPKASADSPPRAPSSGGGGGGGGGGEGGEGGGERGDGGGGCDGGGGST